MSSLTPDKTSTMTLSLTSTTNNNSNSSRISDLYTTRTGRASWYLNMTDEDDDIPHSIPEIQSAPSSPRLRGVDINFDTTTKNDSINNIYNNDSLPVPKLFLTGNNILNKEHRRSLSCDDNFTNNSSNYKGIPLSSNNVEKNKKVYGLYLNHHSSSLVNLQSSNLQSSSSKSTTTNINDDTDDELIDDLKEFGVDRYLNFENKNEKIININVTIPSPTL
ncbi:162_t:CDS:1 [Diversispora eburnea]|uniref:162_t:CDS:1 n=1 Tax=Diversispora eburnea TaxID=1213867 RepID=A0A9N9AKV4_9GLOM|nr:162_t:CDS:1 [Diversispora eburnea]